MTRHRRHLSTVAAALVAVVGAVALTSPAEAGRRDRTTCDRTYVRVDLNRHRAINRYRWQSGQYDTYAVHRGRVYRTGYRDTYAYRYGSYCAPRRHNVRANRHCGRRYRGR